jgi:cyclic pyranopterin phosphate synthase
MSVYKDYIIIQLVNFVDFGTGQYQYVLRMLSMVLQVLPERLLLFMLENNSCNHRNRDHFGRLINYLRLSITDRCNLRCCYCMPAEGVIPCSHTDILSYEDLIKIAEAAVDLGIEKVRITGGEPLVRKGMIPFLSRLGGISSLSEMTLTTNGMLLAENALALKRTGLNRLNISLDSLETDTYARITRGGDLKQVLRGIEVAEKLGFPVKLNMVVMRGINDHEINKFAELSMERPWSIRFIEYMPTIRDKAWQSRMVPGDEIISRLAMRYELKPLANSRLCGPAKLYHIFNAKGSIGIITPLSEHFCHKCNRIRVTSQGMAKSCLLSDWALDLKPALKLGREVLSQALFDVISNKKGQHRFTEEDGTVEMSRFGG